MGQVLQPDRTTAHHGADTSVVTTVQTPESKMKHFILENPWKIGKLVDVHQFGVAVNQSIPVKTQGGGKAVNSIQLVICQSVSPVSPFLPQAGG